jgi:hypothetical protein
LFVLLFVVCKGENGYVEEDDSLIRTGPNVASMVAENAYLYRTHESVIDSCSFTPPHFVVPWTDNDGRKFATVFVSLPSGMVLSQVNDTLKPTVSEDGNFLGVTCVWPEVLYNLNILGTGWNGHAKLSSTQIVCMMLAATQVLTGMKSTCGVKRLDPVVGTARFRLPFQVESKIYSIVLVMDNETNKGTVLMVVMKEKNKTIDDTEIAFKVRVAGTSATTSKKFTGFDMTCLQEKPRSRKYQKDDDNSDC